MARRRRPVKTDGVSDEGYLLDNAQSEAGRRFDALAELLDPVTLRHAEALGLGPGWRVWEVGAGGPGLATALAARVGATGRVLATDIDVSWLPAGAPFDVLRHDVGTEPAPASDLDLVHARLVLGHVPARDDALRSMAGALRPGGWLLVEEADPGLQPLLSPDEHGPREQLANRLRRGFRELMAQRGVDLAYGRTLPRRLRELGLEDVRADAYFPIASPACTALEIATVEQVRDRLLAAGLATEAEVEEHLAGVRQGDMDLATSPLVSAWARRPA